VTTGGGGDGEEVIDWVLRAYENDKALPNPALLVLGPFMHSDRQRSSSSAPTSCPTVEAITFDAQIEHLMARAIGVVAMGGYNTFCEILSFDKRAVIVPRTQPRMETVHPRQGGGRARPLVMLTDDDVRDWKRMATALRQLPQQALPSQVVVPGLMDGLTNINRLVDQTIDAAPARTPRPRLRLASRRAR
jgi:predicted glycosyltransferase